MVIPVESLIKEPELGFYQPHIPAAGIYNLFSKIWKILKTVIQQHIIELTKEIVTHVESRTELSPLEITESTHLFNVNPYIWQILFSVLAEVEQVHIPLEVETEVVRVDEKSLQRSTELESPWHEYPALPEGRQLPSQIILEKST